MNAHSFGRVLLTGLLACACATTVAVETAAATNATAVHFSYDPVNHRLTVTGTDKTADADGSDIIQVGEVGDGGVWFTAADPYTVDPTSPCEYDPVSESHTCTRSSTGSQLWVTATLLSGVDVFYSESGLAGIIDGGADGDLFYRSDDPGSPSRLTYRGGSGVDAVSYFGLDRGVGARVRVNGIADDGMPGDGENVLSDVERFEGTEYRDSFTGDDSAESFHTFGGDDVVYGNGGGDTVNDTGGTDFLSGGFGDDTIETRGSGLTDVVYGDEGSDTIKTADGFPSNISCGEGGAGEHDTVTADRAALDSVTADCESVTRR